MCVCQSFMRRSVGPAGSGGIARSAACVIIYECQTAYQAELSWLKEAVLAH